MTEKSQHSYERSGKMYYPTAFSKGNATYRYINTFEPLPWQKEPWADISPILLLTGAAGGGKSVLAGEKIHGFMLKYPNSRGMVIRKTKDSCEKTAVTLLDREVIGADPRVKHRTNMDRFEYSNGSLLMYDGMNDEKAMTRIRSHNLDIIWIEEATELAEEDFNELIARIRGTAAPWTQIILTTNPDGPLHWINRRLILGGEASVYYSKATDNYYNPPSYIEALKKLTGVQKERLLYGKWVLSSGIIFDTWDDDYNAQTGIGHGNVVKEADYQPGLGDVVWAIDDGYSGEVDKNTGFFTGRSHPRAILIAQKRQNGQLAVFYESYAIERLADDHIRDVLWQSEQNGWPRPVYVVRDRAAASLEGALKSNGISRIKFNTINVDESIKETRTWVAADRNDFRRVIIHPRCKFLRYEMAQYSEDSNGQIIKQHDNGVDALRYLVWEEAYGDSHRTVDVVSWSDFVRKKNAMVTS